MRIRIHNSALKCCGSGMLNPIQDFDFSVLDPGSKRSLIRNPQHCVDPLHIFQHQNCPVEKLVNKVTEKNNPYLGKRLPDGVDLGGVSAALHPDPDIDVGKAILAEEQDRLLQFELEGAGLNQLQGSSVHLRRHLHI